jgi:hypothetical protein
MAKKAKTELAVQSAARPQLYVDPRIAVGMFFTLTGTILSAFGFSTRGRADVYVKTLGIDANLWWGLPLLVFGIAMLAFGRRGQMKMEKTENRK